MSWKVTLDGQSMLLDDLTQEAFVEAAAGSIETTWLRLYVDPRSDLRGCYRLIARCALALGVRAPEYPSTPAAQAALLACIEAVEDRDQID